MEDNVRLKITSSWISTSKDYLEIVRLKKEIADTVKYYVETSLGGETLILIEEAKNINSDCILEQEDIGRSFFDDFIGKYLPDSGRGFYKLLPRYCTYYGRYVETFNTYVVPEIRNLSIFFNDQFPRLFNSYYLSDFERLENTNKEAYDTLKNLLIQYISVCNRLSDKVDLICMTLLDKEMTKKRLKKELPELYKLC